MARKLRRLKITEKPLGRQKAWGIYYPPQREGGPAEIVIDPRHPNPKAALDTTLHETLHHIFPRMSETEVKRASSDLTEVLWALDYRRVKQ